MRLSRQEKWGLIEDTCVRRETQSEKGRGNIEVTKIDGGGDNFGGYMRHG